jgi:hypothetical protein
MIPIISYPMGTYTYGTVHNGLLFMILEARRESREKEAIRAIGENAETRETRGFRVNQESRVQRELESE